MKEIQAISLLDSHPEWRGKAYQERNGEWKIVISSSGAITLDFLHGIQIECTRRGLSCLVEQSIIELK